VDFFDVERRRVTRRPQDAGAVTIVLLVRDLDEIFTRATLAKVPVVTTGGAPVRVQAPGLGGRAVILAGPDGQLVEVRQPDPLPPTTAPDSSNVIGARLRLTVGSMDTALAMYRDRLGFDVAMGAFSRDQAFAALLGIAGGQMRVSTVSVPGSPLQIDFLEFDGADGTSMPSRIQDPGSMRLQLSGVDSDRVARALQDGGGAVISTRGQVFTYTTAPARPGVPFRLAIVRDVNNLFLVLMQGPQGERRP
jgi:hypothetical protein